MIDESQGYLVWKSDRKNYVLANDSLEIIHPVTTLKISEVLKEQRPMILQTIWCKQVGFINRNIGKTDELDEQIAKELNIW